MKIGKKNLGFRTLQKENRHEYVISPYMYEQKKKKNDVKQE